MLTWFLLTGGLRINFSRCTWLVCVAHLLQLTLCFQMCQLQSELEEEWRSKCKQLLASAKEQHSSELAELMDQRDLLQNQLRALQEKVGCCYQGVSLVP